MELRAAAAGLSLYHPAIHVRTRDTALVSHQYKATVVFVSNCMSACI